MLLHFLYHIFSPQYTSGNPVNKQLTPHHPFKRGWEFYKFQNCTTIYIILYLLCIQHFRQKIVYPASLRLKLILYFQILYVLLKMKYHIQHRESTYREEIQEEKMTFLMKNILFYFIFIRHTIMQNLFFQNVDLSI